MLKLATQPALPGMSASGQHSLFRVQQGEALSGMFGYDEFRVLFVNDQWCVQDGGHFYPQVSEAEALAYAVAQADQSQSLGRDAQVVLESTDGETAIVWKTSGHANR
jgi:hypothetical protein